MSRPRWTNASVDDAPVLGAFNQQLALDEAAAPLPDLNAYVERMHAWLSQQRWRAAIAWDDEQPVAYVVWREDVEYDDVFIRQFLVTRERRSQGLGRTLFAAATHELWPGRPLRLDVYDSNPAGARFWQSVGFEPYSRLMRRKPHDHSA